MAEESTQRQVTSLLVRRSRTLEFLHFRAPKGRPIPAQANEGVKKSLVAGSCAPTAMHQSTRSRHSTLEEFSTCAPHLRILNLIIRPRENSRRVLRPPLPCGYSPICRFPSKRCRQQKARGDSEVASV